MAKKKKAQKIKTTEQQSESSMDIQHDGDHYKNLAIQPAEYCQRNRLNCCESYAIKHITRHPSKGEGVTDLKKALHYIQMALEMEYGVKSEFTFHEPVE